MSTITQMPAQLNWQWHSTTDEPSVLRAQSNVDITEGADAPFQYRIDISGEGPVFTAWYEGDNLLRRITKGTLTQMLHDCQHHEDTVMRQPGKSAVD